jgi:hypothetical protein
MKGFGFHLEHKKNARNHTNNIFPGCRCKICIHSEKSNPRLLIYQGVCDNQENYTETLPATNRVIKPTNARREA